MTGVVTKSYNNARLLYDAVRNVDDYGLLHPTGQR